MYNAILKTWLRDHTLPALYHYRPGSTIEVLGVYTDSLDRECVFARTPDGREHVVFKTEIEEEIAP